LEPYRQKVLAKIERKTNKKALKKVKLLIEQGQEEFLNDETMKYEISEEEE